MIQEVYAIRNLTQRNEQLIQLAEEANELAIAAMKYRKYMSSDMFDRKILDNYIEEIADVKICIDIVGDYLKYIEIVKQQKMELTIYDALGCLAEWCCILSKAAIKLRRTIVKNGSPTPVDNKEAEKNLFKAICNVKLYIDHTGKYWDCPRVNIIYKAKADRCIKRFVELNK